MAETKETTYKNVQNAQIIIPEKKDNVNHPSHYTGGNIEVIDYIQDVCSQINDGFVGVCVGNIIKYISRHEYKGGLEDLKKAQWYLNRLIEYKEKDNA